MNDSFNSYIYLPNERFEFLEERRDLISWLVILISILLLVLEIIYPALIIFSVIAVINIWILITRTNTYPKLNGTLHSKIEITPSKITIGENEFNINDVKIHRIVCFDYRGRKELSYSLAIKYMTKSNGVYNHIWFSKNNEEYRFNFQVDSMHHMQVLEEIKSQLDIG